VCAAEGELSTRKEREQRFRIDLVLDAAVELFVESSYEETSVEAIARRAEISVATLYTLFDSKRDIYKATIRRALDRFFVGLDARLDQARGPLEQVRELMRFHLDHFTLEARNFRSFTDTGNVAGMQIKSEVEREPSENKVEFFKRLIEICQAGIDEGIFKKGLAPELMALALMSVPHSILSYWLEHEGRELSSLLPQALEMVERVTGASF